MIKTLILLRGLPGAGKSSLAKVLAENKWPVFSVDDYFTDAKTGAYRFEFDKNHLAYKACEENCRKAMEKGMEKIFIDNTFTLDWELQAYFKLASAFNYTLFVCTVENYHEQKNTHGISDEQIQKMADKYKVKLF
jgi:predicted kinase